MRKVVRDKEGSQGQEARRGELTMGNRVHSTSKHRSRKEKIGRLSREEPRETETETATEILG